MCEIHEVRPIGQVGVRTLDQAESVDHVAARVGGAQAVQGGQARALAQDESVQRAIAKRRVGFCLNDLVGDCQQYQVHLLDG